MQVTLSPLAWMRSPWERVSHSTLEGPSWVPGALHSLGKGDKSSGLQELTFLWGRLMLNNQVLECSAEVMGGASRMPAWLFCVGRRVPTLLCGGV